MITTARVLDYDGTVLTLCPEEPIFREMIRKNVATVELRLDDGRRISAGQRKKIFATIRDIANWCGHDPEELRRFLTWDFRSRDGGPDFSLSDVDMTTASGFISYLIEFCFRWGVPTREALLDRTDDIGRYLYLCLEHRKCAVCNKRAQVHHVDAVGMGRDRAGIVHEGMRAIALCPEHHREAHQKGPDFFNEHHVYGIKLDRYLCEVLRLKTGKDE